MVYPVRLVLLLYSSPINTETVKENTCRFYESAGVYFSRIVNGRPADVIKKFLGLEAFTHPTTC